MSVRFSIIWALVIALLSGCGNSQQNGQSNESSSAPNVASNTNTGSGAMALPDCGAKEVLAQAEPIVSKEVTETTRSAVEDHMRTERGWAIAGKIIGGDNKSVDALSVLAASEGKKLPEQLTETKKLNQLGTDVSSIKVGLDKPHPAKMDKDLGIVTCEAVIKTTGEGRAVLDMSGMYDLQLREAIKKQKQQAAQESNSVRNELAALEGVETKVKSITPAEQLTPQQTAEKETKEVFMQYVATLQAANPNLQYDMKTWVIYEPLPPSVSSDALVHYTAQFTNGKEVFVKLVPPPTANAQ